MPSTTGSGLPFDVFFFIFFFALLTTPVAPDLSRRMGNSTFVILAEVLAVSVHVIV